jgi:uncharacterized repeat protein (TIGR03803 family)
MNKLDWWKTAYAVSLLCAATTIGSRAQTLTTLYDFTQPGRGTTNVTPSQLIQGADGNLYGTTEYGGANYWGSVFKITPDGKLTTLYSFGSDGVQPLNAPLVQATDGNFYGTTASGGANGAGTVFKMTPGGTLSTLYSFCPQINCTDGVGPLGALVEGPDGNFYGVTIGGGTYTCSIDSFGCGTIFRITPGGTLTTLHEFDGRDGGNPAAGLVQGTDGNFYGTTETGGTSSNCTILDWVGCGSVFKITPSGTLTNLYSFDWTDGGVPLTTLLQASDGNFYGTTSNGGECGGEGTIFRITPSGALTTLVNCADAGFGGLVQATDGNFYGTDFPGAFGQGAIFKMTLNGTLTDIYSFCSQSGCPDGSNPLAGLVQHTNGSFYGTTLLGGTGTACLAGCGTIFSLSVGLGGFVETQPSLGKVGTTIKILGTNLAGSTSVTFNGTPTAFTVESSSYIKTTVPAGATTGTVQVITPSGTLSSNVPFRVAP